ncbi:hypothetical protein D3C74_284730 [compost metagenome]
MGSIIVLICPAIKPFPDVPTTEQEAVTVPDNSPEGICNTSVVTKNNSPPLPSGPTLVPAGITVADVRGMDNANWTVVLAASAGSRLVSYITPISSSTWSRAYLSKF